ncbi:hypothetical protein LIA77_03044 [Sarocladium implicatum]|nr:hypothetical protein LIA77_03044 [Sarocladium implicatum]
MAKCVSAWQDCANGPSVHVAVAARRNYRTESKRASLALHHIQLCGGTRSPFEHHRSTCVRGSRRCRGHGNSGPPFLPVRERFEFPVRSQVSTSICMRITWPARGRPMARDQGFVQGLTKEEDVVGLRCQSPVDLPHLARLTRAAIRPEWVSRVFAGSYKRGLPPHEMLRWHRRGEGGDPGRYRLTAPPGIALFRKLLRRHGGGTNAPTH